MKSKRYSCTHTDSLLDSAELSDFDVQVSQHYLPLIQSHYQNALLCHESPQTYLTQKYGIGNEQILKYQLGYSNREIGEQLPPARNALGVKLRGSLCRLKLVRPSGHEAFRGCVTVPIYYQEEITGFYAERIGRVRGSSSSKYWSPITKPCVFNLDAVKGVSAVYMYQSPLIAIQMSRAFGERMIATNTSFQLTTIDCRVLADLGISKVIACSSKPVTKCHLMALGRTLKKFGMEYQPLNLDLEVHYGAV